MTSGLEYERLPLTVTPKLYDLTIVPDLSAFTFRGDLTVSCEAKEAVSEIVLNGIDLQIQKVSWKQADEIEGVVTLDPKDEKIRVSLPKPVSVGAGELIFRYSGVINDQMKGFYRSMGPGEASHTCMTQFEPVDARRALPCWDEPDLKAEFDVTIIVDQEKVALSNMDEVSNVSSTEYPGKKVVKFGRSPMMSTYLLAWAIGDFDCLEAKDANGVKCRVFTPKGKAEHGRFALDLTLKALPYYAEFFGIKYPLTKCDHLAVADFAAGAMENWGLITYRASEVMLDPERAVARLKQRVACVVGHEIAHQWFGNLVTMKWWTDLWLNEGFATWIEYLLVDHAHPEMEVWQQYITMELMPAMRLDCLKTSHPIEVAVEHPNDIDEIFDLISYAKGAAVVRMLFEYLGSDNFRKGLSAYLHRYKYDNAVTLDLWTHLGEASGLDVAAMMGTWTKQMGYPVLTVEQEIKGSERTFTVSQKRFLLDGSSDSDNIWCVPVSITTASSPEKPVHQFVLGKISQTVTVSGIAESDWVNFNPGFNGIFHVVYPKDNLTALLSNISSMTVESKMSLLFDFQQLAKSGGQSTVELLNLISSLKDESSYTVWSTMLVALSEISPIAYSAGVLPQFKKYKINLCEAKAAEIGWEKSSEKESHLDVLLRETLLSTLGVNGHEATVEEARKRFADHVSGTKELSSDLKRCVFNTVAANGDASTIEDLKNLYRKNTDMNERSMLLSAMGRVQDAQLLREVFAFSLGSEVPTNEMRSVVAPSTLNPELADEAWKFFKANVDTFVKAMLPPSSLFQRAVEEITSSLFTAEQMADVDEFFSQKPQDGVSRTLSQAREKCEHRANWINRDKMILAITLKI